MLSWARTSAGNSISFLSYSTPSEVHLASLGSCLEKTDLGRCIHGKILALSKSLSVRKVRIERQKVNNFTFIYRLVLKQSHCFEILVLLLTELSNTCV